MGSSSSNFTPFQIPQQTYGPGPPASPDYGVNTSGTINSMHAGPIPAPATQPTSTAPLSPLGTIGFLGSPFFRGFPMGSYPGYSQVQPPATPDFGVNTPGTINSMQAGSPNTGIGSVTSAPPPTQAQAGSLLGLPLAGAFNPVDAASTLGLGSPQQNTSNILQLNQGATPFASAVMNLLGQKA